MLKPHPYIVNICWTNKNDLFSPKVFSSSSKSVKLNRSKYHSGFFYQEKFSEKLSNEIFKLRFGKKYLEDMKLRNISKKKPQISIENLN